MKDETKPAEETKSSGDSCGALKAGLYWIEDGKAVPAKPAHDGRRKLSVDMETWNKLLSIKKELKRQLKYQPDIEVIVDALVDRLHKKPGFVAKVYIMYHLSLLQEATKKSK